ncbi:MAG: glycoside hydrolase [Planctomycetota bacterium]
MRLPPCLCTLTLIAAAACAQDATVTVDTERPLAEVDARYLSVAIDLANVVGGKWWDASASSEQGRGSGDAEPLALDPQLVALARNLAPAVLRVGGGEADFLYYDLDARGAAPEGYESRLSVERWDEVHAFAEAAGLDLMFTLNAGPTERDARRRWTPDHARRLLEHAREQQQRVAVWELGNEVNAFWFFHGWKARVSGKRYARDYARAQGLVRELAPGARLAGPAAAFWPVLGEPLGWFFGVTKRFLRRAEQPVDVVTWHYYPTQSQRCPVAVRRASLGRMLEPRTLNEVQRWAGKLNRWRDRYQPGAEVWLGETGPAQCGGEPGVSDTFASGFWFLDQLGSVARFGHRIQVRQALIGSDYGLVREDTRAPNPDYWNAVLWKRLMGRHVLDAQVAGSDRVRAYAHATPGRAGSVTVLLLNLADAPRTVRLQGDLGARQATYAVAAPALESQALTLNGAPLALARDGSFALPDSAPAPADELVELPPTSYRFLVFPDAGFRGGLSERLRDE